MHALLNWSEPPNTGLVFGSGLVLLASLITHSVISVVSYLALALVLLGLGGKLYVHLMGMLKKPCKDPLAKLAVLDLTLDQETVEQLLDSGVRTFNQTVAELRCLVLLENYLSSAKFALVMYGLSLLGGLVNTLTLLLVCWVLLFSLPTLYEQKKEQVDSLVSKAVSHYGALNSQLMSLLSGPTKPIPASTKVE